MDSATSVMRQLYRAPEPEVLKPLLARARSVPNERQRIVNRAAGLIGASAVWGSGTRRKASARHGSVV